MSSSKQSFMKYLHKLFITVGFIIFVFVSTAQDKVCNRAAPLYYMFEQVEVQEPEDAQLREQFAKITILKSKTLEMVEGNPDFSVIPFSDYRKVSGQKGYLMIATLYYERGKKDYRFSIGLLTMCGTRIAEVEASFQMYPTWNAEDLAGRSVTALFKKINIRDWELNERASKNVGLGGDHRGGEVSLEMDRGLIKGQTTNVSVRVKDCDGQSLPNKKITTSGTTGGTFTPATFTTDENGYALVKFTKTGDRTAIAKAQCETNNVWGCKDLYTGSQAIRGIEGTPVKIDIVYVENVRQTMKRATLPGVKITGGAETETTFMSHFATLYHYPAEKMLKDNFLVETTQDKSDRPHTLYVVESGWSMWEKNTERAFFVAGPANLVQATEEGEYISHSGSPDGMTKSEVTFYLGKKGDSMNPPTFMWNVQYETSNNGLAGGGANLVKGDSSVKWKETPITDPKSIYKMKYVIEQEIDARKELQQGNKAMKDLFGFDVDKLTGIIDPTNPQTDMFGADGKRIIRVTVWSPYVK
jgi:hypothetical protein